VEKADNNKQFLIIVKALGKKNSKISMSSV